MQPFTTPWKYQKIFRFSNVFRGQRKDALGTNGLIWNINGKITCINGHTIFAIRPKKYSLVSGNRPGEKFFEGHTAANPGAFFSNYPVKSKIKQAT